MQLGSSLSLRSFNRLGSTLSVLDFLYIGSGLSLRSMARVGSSLSILDFLQIGSTLSLRSLNYLFLELLYKMIKSSSSFSYSPVSSFRHCSRQ